MSEYFKGTYYKHQNANETVSVIVGETKNSAFVQVISNKKSYNYTFENLNESKCSFSNSGITLNLPKIKGQISYSELTPIKYDIMGPFKFFPMQCKHGVVSMHHKLLGEIKIEDKVICFDDGVGYIEKDSGSSFPKKYLWISCNSFNENLGEKCSIMISIAHIPFYITNFIGCIGIVIYNNKEYRFATYLGAKIILANKNKIVLKQGKYKIIIDVNKKNSYPLLSPRKGKMSETIYESNDSMATFIFSKNDVEIFKLSSNKVSFECEKLEI